MPAPLARGIIITVTVLLAAGLAAYENPHIREWLDRTRQRMAMSIQHIEDDVDPKRRFSTRSDRSMVEEKGEVAEQRRAQAVADIMERGRLMEERRKRRKMSTEEKPKSRTPSFDTLVDESGALLPEPLYDYDETMQQASSTAVVAAQTVGELRSRHVDVDGQQKAQQSSSNGSGTEQSYAEATPPIQLDNPFESEYEREMIETWNMSIEHAQSPVQSSHESGSLIDFTPINEDVPDPDISTPSAEIISRSNSRSDYFSIPPSNTSNSHIRQSHAEESILTPGPSESMSLIDPIEARDSDEDSSIFGEGVQTPASAWTEVGSTISGST